MRSWQIRLRKNIIHVVERKFVEGAYIPSNALEMMTSVRFAILTEVAKHVKRIMKN
jgi:hypothetical protein